MSRLPRTPSGCLVVSVIASLIRSSNGASSSSHASKSDVLRARPDDVEALADCGIASAVPLILIRLGVDTRVLRCYKLLGALKDWRTAHVCNRSCIVVVAGHALRCQWCYCSSPSRWMQYARLAVLRQRHLLSAAARSVLGPSCWAGAAWWQPSCGSSLRLTRRAISCGPGVYWMDVSE